MSRINLTQTLTKHSQIVLVAAVVMISTVLVVLLALTTVQQPTDLDVADEAGDIILVQSLPPAPTSIFPNESVELQVRTVYGSQQTLGAVVFEITLNVDPTQFTIQDIVPESDLIALNKTVDAATGKATVDVAFGDNQTFTERTWATLKVKAIHTQGVGATVSGKVIGTYSTQSGSETVEYPVSATVQLATVASSSTTTTSTATSTAISTPTSSASTTSTVTTSTTTSSGTGVVCEPIDVDGNVFLDLVDFAAFAKKYNNQCSSYVEDPAGDYTVGEQVTLSILATDIISGANAVDLDLDITNARVVSFAAVQSGGWDLSIPFCLNGESTTSTEVCVAMSKSAAIVEGEKLGDLVIELTAVGQTTVVRGARYAYSEGTTKTIRTGTLYTLDVNSQSSGCGNQDTNKDSWVDLIDFSVLGRRYRKANCGL